MRTPETTTVYLVTQHVPFEGSRVDGVYTDPDQATEHADRETKRAHAGGATDVFHTVDPWTAAAPGRLASAGKIHDTRDR